MMKRVMDDKRQSFGVFVVLVSVVVGVLYTVSYDLWVTTGIHGILWIPPAVLFLYFLTYGKTTSIWRCTNCSTIDISTQCSQCGAWKPIESFFKEHLVYLLVIPVGAILTELVLVGFIESRWTGVAHGWGPAAVVMMTHTAPIAQLLAIGAGGGWAVLSTLWHTGQ